MQRMTLKSTVLVWMVGISALLLLACSSLRHALFQSGAYDLGIFDQAVYLISQGLPPVSSFMGFHILGDHAALIFYPLALLYKIYPDVHWLLAVQAIALAVGAIPTYVLARQAKVNEPQAIALAAVYLLYPLVFNVNLFDFHPDVLALPGLLTAILAARRQRIGWFIISVLVVLSCKAAFGLTIAGLGIWLLLVERRRWCGAIALVAGIAWFMIATQSIIPTFGGAIADIGRHLHRYRHLGRSFPEIAQHLLFQPTLLLTQLFSLETIGYLGLLVLPVIWGLSLRHLTPLIAALPTLAMNILADPASQRDLVHQYSLPILPFLLVSVISTVAAGGGWFKTRRMICLWSLLSFLILAKYGYFGSIYLTSLDTWGATRSAIAQISTNGSVLTTHDIAPHLSQRSQIKFTDRQVPPSLNEFEYVLLNVRHPGWLSDPAFATELVQQLKQAPQFQLLLEQDDVYLFKKNISPTVSSTPIQ